MIKGGLTMKEYLEFAKQIALQAGKIMLKYFKEDNGANYNISKPYVTSIIQILNGFATAPMVL